MDRTDIIIHPIQQTLLFSSLNCMCLIKNFIFLLLFSACFSIPFRYKRSRNYLLHFFFPGLHFSSFFLYSTRVTHGICVCILSTCMRRERTRKEYNVRRTTQYSTNPKAPFILFFFLQTQL